MRPCAFICRVPRDCISPCALVVTLRWLEEMLWVGIDLSLWVVILNFVWTWVLPLGMRYLDVALWAKEKRE